MTLHALNGVEVAVAGESGYVLYSNLWAALQKTTGSGVDSSERSVPVLLSTQSKTGGKVVIYSRIHSVVSIVPRGPGERKKPTSYPHPIPPASTSPATHPSVEVILKAMQVTKKKEKKKRKKDLN